MKKDRKKFLQDLRKKSEKENVPIITEINAQFLHFLLKSRKSKTVLEIGTANGYSAIWLADAVEKFGGKVITIEHSELSSKIAEQNFCSSKSKNIILKKGRAQEILPKMREKFDFIFIDAMKKDYHLFFELSKKLLKKDGLIVADDVLKFREKMELFYKKLKSEKEWEYVILPIDLDDGVMLIQKKQKN